MTEFSQETFSFAPHFSRRVEAGFTAGQVSSDGRSLLLRETDRRIDLLGVWRAVAAMAVGLMSASSSSDSEYSSLRSRNSRTNGL